MSIQSVMVSVDGSRFSETAVPVARQLARTARASLTIVMAHEMAGVPTAAGVGESDDRDGQGIRVLEKTYLAEIALANAHTGGIPVGFRLIEGSPGPALIAEMDLARPDLLVMSTHGRGVLSRLWLGSVADYVVRHATQPMLLLPGSANVAADCSFRRGLVLMDRTEAAEAVLGPVAEFAALHQSHLTLMHVLEPEPGALGMASGESVPPRDSQLGGEYRKAQRYLDGLAHELRAHGIQVATRVVVGLGAAPTILQQIEVGGYDFVAMTTHAGSGMVAPLLGRVADKVIRGAERPVFLVRPRAAP